MMTPQEIVEAALAGANGCQLAVVVSHAAQLNLRWAGSALTTNGAITQRQVDVVAMHPDGGTATASGQVASRSDVARLVASARDSALGSQPSDDRALLPDGTTGSDWTLEPGDVDAQMLQPLATGLGKWFRAASDNGHFGYAEYDVTTTYLGTTAGSRLRHVQRQSRAEFTAKADNGRRSSWVGRADPDLAVDLTSVEEELRRGLADQATVMDVSPGRHRVILAPSATADLMIELYWAADARAALEGRSVFAAAPGATRIGETLAPGITLGSDPNDRGPAMACRPFEVATASSDSSSTFDNALPLTPTDWISDGVLTNLISTRHTAAALDHPATPGIDNLTMKVTGGHGATADLVARTEDALLITCLWYNRVVDPQTLLITGLTRDGVYVVRDGRIVGSSGNFRFNESPVSLLGRIVEAGGEERTLAREMGDYFNRATMPALLVREFNLSTASEAH